MASSEQLEREAEATRARIAATLAELRTRISPGQMLDEAIDLARDGNGADMVRMLGRQAADNPMPVALLGAGLAWLMLAQRKAKDGHAARMSNGDGSVATTEPASLNDMYDRTNRTTAMASKTEKTTRRVSRKAEAATDKAADAAGGVYERASDMMDRARETTSETYGRARDAMSSAMKGTRSLTQFMQEEPLVVAGLGIALGALVGALLPATDLENRAMGEASDQLKRDAREAAREQWERGKDLAEDGWDEAKEAARRTWDDAKAEAEKSWEDTKSHASDRADGHAGDTTGAEASIVPEGDEKKSRRRASAETRSS